MCANISLILQTSDHFPSFLTTIQNSQKLFDEFAGIPKNFQEFKNMRLKQWAQQQGICYKTALQWFHAGRIPNSRQLDTGTILVDSEPEKVFVYVIPEELKKELQK